MRTYFGVMLAVALCPSVVFAQAVVTGVVYEVEASATRALAAARVFLVDEESGEDLAREALSFGQQGQETGAQGLYRFDLRDAALPRRLRIRLETPRASLRFPAAGRLPQGASNAFPDGAVFAPAGLVSQVEQSFPVLSDPANYHLRFELGTGDIVLNNHLPVEESAGIVQLAGNIGGQLLFSQSSTHYYLDIQNTSSNIFDDLGVTLNVVGASPGEAQYRESSGTPSTPTRRSVGIEDFEYRIPNLGAFESGRLRIPIVVKAGAQRLRIAANLRSGDVLLATPEINEVSIETDPIFEKATVLGRVFCDDDENGLKSAEERPVVGARIVLSDGRELSTDGAGHFHAQDLDPGRQPLKLNQSSLWPGYEPRVEALQVPLLSAGSLVKVNFPLRCRPGKWFRSAEHIPQVSNLWATPKDQALPTDFAWRGSELFVDGAPYTLPWADADLVWNNGEDVMQPGREGRVFLSLPEFKVHRWSINIFKTPIAGQAYSLRWQKSGVERPESEVPLTWPDEAAEPGQYILYFQAQTDEGHIAYSKWSSVNVVPQDGPKAVIRGDYFDDATPKDGLKKALRDAFADFNFASAKLRVEVHEAAGSSRTTLLIRSQKKALVVAKILSEFGVAPDAVQAQGKGDARPIMPNITKAGQRMNTRIEVYWLNPSSPATAPLEYPARFVANNIEQVYELGLSTLDEPPRSVLFQERNGRSIVLYFKQEQPSGTTHFIDVQSRLSDGNIFLGDEVVNVPYFNARCSTELDGQTFSFSLAGGAKNRPYSVQLLDSSKAIVASVKGEGLVRINRNQVLTATHFRCEQDLGDGEHVLSAPQKIPVVEIQDASVSGESILLSGEKYPEDNFGIETLARLGEFLGQTGPGAGVTVEVHDNNEGGKVNAQIRSSRIAARLKDALLALGFLESRITLKAMGANAPIMPVTSQRANAMNRRVVLTLDRPKLETAAVSDVVFSGEEKLIVAGVKMKLGEDNVFRGRVARSSGDMSFVVQAKDGRVLRFVRRKGLRLERQAPRSPAHWMPQDTSPLNPSGRSATPVGDANLSSSVEEPPIASSEDALADVPLPSLAESGGETKIVSASGPQEKPEPSGPAVLIEPSGDPVLKESSGPRVLVLPNDTSGVDAEISQAPPSSGAGWLSVYWPDPTIRLLGRSLSFHGTVPPGTRVWVNDEEVHSDRDGRFFTTVNFLGDDSGVEVRARRPDGDEASIRQPFVVPKGEYFVMAFGDLGFGWGAPMMDTNEDTRLDLPEELYLHGRLVGHFKGRLRGDALFKASPFRDYKLTAHVDTGAPRTDEIYRQWIDPDRFYPVYGDASAQVQPGASRYKVYVLLEADESSLQIGNVVADYVDGYVYRYERSIFGGEIELDHEFAKKFRSRVKIHAGAHNSGTQRRTSTFLGTGGSLYTLPNAPLTPGSERVELVVRDVNTGIEIHRKTLVRDLDYRIDHLLGRLSLNRPVASRVSNTFGAYHAMPAPSFGHPLYVEVAYESGASDGFAEKLSVGGEFRQTFGDFITIGATALRDEQDNTAYALYAGHAELKIPRSGKLRAEFAYSESQRQDYDFSTDGGLSFGRLGGPLPLSDTQRGAAGAIRFEADAWKWRGAAQKSDGGEKVEGETLMPDEDTERLPIRLYFEHRDAEYYGGIGVLEQGQSKYGLSVSYAVNEAHRVGLRHDGVWSDLGAAGILHREMTTAAYTFSSERFAFNTRLAYGLFDDQAGDVLHTGLASVGAEYQVLKGLGIFLKQDAIVGGDSRVIGSDLDRFATTAGLRWTVSERTTLELSETLRWSGTNSTDLGLYQRVDDQTRVYASHSLAPDAQRRVQSASVVGIETQLSNGLRSYGEYHLQNAWSAQAGRAVMGMDGRFDVAPGLSLSLAYERSQRLGQALPTQVQSDAYRASVDNFLGRSSSPIAAGRAFSASGYQNAGTFPVGLASRDAASLGLQYRLDEWFTFAGRVELRYDRPDPALRDGETEAFEDHLFVFGQASASARVARHLTLLARFAGASSLNTEVDTPTTDGAYREYIDVTLGGAFRPQRRDIFDGLFKWTRRYLFDGGGESQTIDSFSVEPVGELGFGLQLSAKFGLRYDRSAEQSTGESRESSRVLVLGRLAYHLNSIFDVAGEYRYTADILDLPASGQHGAVLEFAWLPIKHMSVGLGYNFAGLPQDLLNVSPSDENGVYLRVTGRY